MLLARCGQAARTWARPVSGASASFLRARPLAAPLQSVAALHSTAPRHFGLEEFYDTKNRTLANEDMVFGRAWEVEYTPRVSRCVGSCETRRDEPCCLELCESCARARACDCVQDESEVPMNSTPLRFRAFQLTNLTREGERAAEEELRGFAQALVRPLQGAQRP